MALSTLSDEKQNNFFIYSIESWKAIFFSVSSQALFNGLSTGWTASVLIDVNHSTSHYLDLFNRFHFICSIFSINRKQNRVFAEELSNQLRITDLLFQTISLEFDVFAEFQFKLNIKILELNTISKGGLVLFGWPFMFISD